MKGYRTVIFSAVVMLGGMVGWHVAPDVINNYLDIIFAAIGVGVLVLRIVTTTPFGAAVAADLGTKPSDLEYLLSKLDPDMSDNLNSAISDLNTAVGKLTGHVPVAQATIDALAAVAQTITSTVASSTAPPQPVTAAGQAATALGTASSAINSATTAIDSATTALVQ